MDSLTTPKFKSKVEQFYYENRASELDLTNEEVFSDSESPRHKINQKGITEARKRAYSGDGRKSFFTFDHVDIDLRNSDFEKHGSISYYYYYGVRFQNCLRQNFALSHLWLVLRNQYHCT